MLSGAPYIYMVIPLSLTGNIQKIKQVNKMKIVVWKSPKYLSKIISKLFGVEEKEKKRK